MSHRLSQNARHTRELLEELERDKELDVLREYLTRFELFPRQRDPAAAPIRFEELKELAKHWKLHRQRNFWKTNTTKEDLVRTLYRHINTKIIPQESRDEGNGTGSPSHMANSPGAGMSPSAPANRHTSISDSPRTRSLRPIPPSSRGPRIDSVFGGYNGDLFGQRGNYEDGMIYLSRFRKPTTLLNNVDGVSSALNSVAGSDSTLSRHSKLKDEDDDEDEDDEQEPSADTLDFNAGLTREIRLKQECAFSIYHFSTIPGHERQMVAEGCMLALSKLAVFEDTEVKRFCAASILNLLCESALGTKMADEGVLLALLELAKAQHEEVRRHTSMSLCRFSYERGGQLRLVQEGCVSAILSMLNVPDLETKEACVKALINIASASGASVAESVVHVLMKLATRKDQTSARFAAEAICNLSLLSGSRPKIVEEGILDTVCELAQQISVAAAAGVGEDSEDGGDIGMVRKYLATALCNLSGLPGNLEPLSHSRILECLEELLKCEKPREVREMCAVTIANISSHPPSLKNLALSDAVANLVEIGTHHTSNTVRENTALCLSNMSATADSRALLARFGVVSLLLRFLEEDEAAGTALAQQFAVLTLCSLLAHPAASTELLQSNMPAALARLATRTPHDRVRELCANALFNVSCERSLHGVLLQDDTIRAIVRLCKRKGDVDDDAASGTAATGTPAAPSTPAASSGPPVVLLRHQECALGCLLNLSFGAESRPSLLRADVVSTLAKLFQKPPARSDELLRQCAGVLANLSFDAEARARIVADQGVRLIRRIMSAATASANAAASSDMPVSAASVTIIRETLRSCATACCNLAADALEKTPILDMLIDLSASSHPPTTLTCAIAFAKMASSATHRAHLTRCAELYPALTLMMRCGVEDIQIYSAVALCNLAVEPPAAKPVGVRYVWKEGTVPDFIVNALLRINSDSTKEICARALFNLLTHDELRAAHIKDGVLYALVKLARLESVEIRTLCVAALYNLSCDPALAETLMELKVAQVITKLCEMEFSSQEIHRRLAACLTNMASEPKPPAGKKADTAAAAASASMGVRLVESGALVALLVLCEHADPPTRHACAAALCFLSAYRVNCEAMATLGLVDVLTKKLLLAPVDVETPENDDEYSTIEQRQQHEFALNALCNISCYQALHDRMEEAGAVPQIIRLLATTMNHGQRENGDDQDDQAIILACVQTLANLTFHARHRHEMLTHKLVPTLLCRPQALRSSQRIGDVCAEIIGTLCEDTLHWQELIATGAVRVLREITDVSTQSESPSPAALRASIYALSQLARCEKSGETVLVDGALNVVSRALDLGKDLMNLEDGPAKTKAHEARQEMAERCAVILRALSTQGEAVCLMLMRDMKLVPMLNTIISTCCPGRRQLQASKHLILALYNLTSCRVSVDDEEEDGANTSDANDGSTSEPKESEGMRGLDMMVITGVVPLLVRLSTDGGSDMAPACAVALAHIKHRIKERLAQWQNMPQNDSAEHPQRRKFEEIDNMMEAGVITALLAMFELDPAGIQRVDRLAAAMPPALAVLRSATEKDWTFYPGNTGLHFETPLPVCWDFRSSAIDDARFVPAEPRTFLATLSPVVPASGVAIQDKLYGKFRVLRVRLNKCLLHLENSRFAKHAAAVLASATAGSTSSSATDLSDAIAMAIGDNEDDLDDDDDDDDRPHRKTSAARRPAGGASSRSNTSSVITDDDDAGSEMRMPSPVKKKSHTGRSLLMNRAGSSRGSAAFGIGSGSGSSTDSTASLQQRRSSKAPNGRKTSHLSHDNSSSSISYIARKGSSSRRFGSDSSSSSGVTLPKL